MNTGFKSVMALGVALAACFAMPVGAQAPAGGGHMHH